MSFSLPSKHVFFGYYDVCQFDREEKRILVHVVPKRADTAVHNAEIGYYSLTDGSYHKLTETAAWCWQQGARLRWHPLLDDVIIYNDLIKDSYVSREYSIKDGVVIRNYNNAFYDISKDMKYGLSLNFSRLQRLRPGYGYSKLKDMTSDDIAPENDGIFYVDLQSGKTDLLISLQELAATVPDECLEAKSEHYVNHISISPDGNRFMFFHIWTIPSTNRWNTRLYIYELETKSLTLAEDRYITSHYCWKGNDTLLLTCYDGLHCFYEEIECKTCCTRSINENNLHFDGHPTYLLDHENFISDSYPNRKSEQRVICASVNPEKTEIETIATIFHNPFMDGEKRCDLHPRVALSNEKICIDTTCSRGVRKCVVFDL